MSLNCPQLRIRKDPGPTVGMLLNLGGVLLFSTLPFSEPPKRQPHFGDGSLAAFKFCTLTFWKPPLKIPFHLLIPLLLSLFWYCSIVTKPSTSHFSLCQLLFCCLWYCTLLSFQPNQSGQRAVVLYLTAFVNLKAIAAI